MKKLIVIAAVSMLFLQQAAAYTWTIKNNNPTGRVRVTLNAVGRPSNYKTEINPGSEWNQQTGIYCVKSALIEGISEPYIGQKVTVTPPSTACKGYTVEIGHKTNIETNQYTGITTQKDTLDAKIFY